MSHARKGVACQETTVTDTKRVARGNEKKDALKDAARAEARTRAHGRIAPDAALMPIEAVNLYVEAFIAGAQFAEARREGAMIPSHAFRLRIPSRRWRQLPAICVVPA